MSNSAVNVPAYPKVIYPGASTHEEAAQSSTELLMLWQAISNCAIPMVHQLIQQKPKLIHEKGWNGLTALHKACLMGDWTVNYLLVEAGSDVNALNNFDETPLHYACMRGVPSVIHLLIQRGGNIQAVDKNGRNVAHHTARTGSIYAMKYLEEQGVSFRGLDKELQTPAHIVCRYGHVEALRFLVKKERSDLTQVDKDGNTPLHLAAREGFGYMCWLILGLTGCSVLHSPNREGFTPVDLGGRGDRVGHKDLKPELEYWAKSKDKNSKPRGPVLSWHFLLFFPGTWYAFLVFLSIYAFPSHQGLVILVGMMGLLYYLMTQFHRLPHISRWSNPVYAGTFSAGIFHTTFVYLAHMLTYTLYHPVFSGVCFLGILTLIYYFVKMLRTEPDTKEYYYFTIFCLLLMFPFFYIYWKVLKDPTGKVTQSIPHPETKEPMTIVDLCVLQRKLEEMCVICEIVRQEKTKHCKLCDECYYRMDHHCLFLLKCIAKNNHVLFLRFLMFVMFSMIVFLVNVVLYCGGRYPNITIYQTIVELFWFDGWVISLVVMNLLSILWIVNLLRYQFNLVATGQTTVFLAKTRSVLTPSERIMNILYFLSGRQPYAVDPVICMQGETV